MNKMQDEISGIYKDLSLLLIKDDVEAMYSICYVAVDKRDDASILFLGLMPYFCMCSDGMLSFFEEQGIEIGSIKINGIYRKVLKKMRLKSKLYNEKISKNMSQLENVQEQKNDYFKNLLIF